MIANVNGGAGTEPDPATITLRRSQTSPVITGYPFGLIGRLAFTRKDQTWFRSTLAKRALTLSVLAAAENSNRAVSA